MKCSRPRHVGDHPRGREGQGFPDRMPRLAQISAIGGQVDCEGMRGRSRRRQHPQTIVGGYELGRLKIDLVGDPVDPRTEVKVCIGRCASFGQQQVGIGRTAVTDDQRKVGDGCTQRKTVIGPGSGRIGAHESLGFENGSGCEKAHQRKHPPVVRFHSVLRTG